MTSVVCRLTVPWLRPIPSLMRLLLATSTYRVLPASQATPHASLALSLQMTRRDHSITFPSFPQLGRARRRKRQQPTSRMSEQ